MIINGVTIEDTFAEAFTMRVARIDRKSVV